MKNHNIDARRKPRRKTGGGSSLKVTVDPTSLNWLTYRGEGSPNCLQSATIPGTNKIAIRNSANPSFMVTGTQAEITAFAKGFLSHDVTIG